MPFALIPFGLLLVPIMEIAVFILVGGAIGLWPTLGLIVVTAIAGSILLRRQGLSTLQRIQTEVKANRVPGNELVNGVLIAVAGVLLLVPGFVTDALGLLLFVPGIRTAIFDYLKRRVVVVGGQGFDAGPRGRPGPSRPGEPDVVDLSGEEFQRRQPDPSSPWHEGTGSDTTQPPSRTLH